MRSEEEGKTEVRVGGPESRPVIIATLLRPEGDTGIHTHFRQLMQYLDRSGVSPVLVTPFSSAKRLSYPIFALRRLIPQRFCGSVSVAWYLYWHALFLRLALRKRLSSLGDCVIYAQGPLEAWAAQRARRGSHQSIVMAVHFRTSLADEWANKGSINRDGVVFRGIRRYERIAIPRTEAIVYVSRWARAALQNWLPEVGDVPCAVIDNFVAPVRTDVAAGSLGDLVTIGSLENVKNHRFLLQVLAEVRRTGRNLSLDIYGDGPLRKELAELAASSGLEADVHLHGFRPDVREMLPGYRVYVHASYSESSSLAIIEAMAAGLPVVAGNIGPISELCDDGVEARFWPLDDASKAAAILLELLDSESARSIASEAARERFRRGFHVDVLAPKLLHFLENR